MCVCVCVCDFPANFQWLWLDVLPGIKSKLGKLNPGDLVNMTIKSVNKNGALGKLASGIDCLVTMEHMAGKWCTSWMVITNKSQAQAQTQDGVLCSISISNSGMVIIKILRLFSYSGLSLKLRNPEIGLYHAQELYSR